MDEHLQDPRTMHPRELLRGLMRGNAGEHKQGYEPVAAVLAVNDVQDLDRETREKLASYAGGFFAGMTVQNPEEFAAGVNSGIEEERGKINPGKPRVPRPSPTIADDVRMDRQMDVDHEDPDAGES